MRFSTTIAFSEARTNYEAALKGYASFDDTAENEKELEEEAWKHLSAASDALFDLPAMTAAEVIAKLDAAHERGRDDFPIEDYYTKEVMQRDLQRIQRCEVSEPFATAWRVWRKVQDSIEEYGAEAERGFAPGQTLDDLRSNLYCEIALKHCTTPGDFILKQYMRLLTTRGGCEGHAYREDGTENPWDIDISDFTDDARFEHADILGTYNDLDDCDVGANLLAYGQLEFNAEAWMEAADRVGHNVMLVQQPDGSWGFWSDVDGNDQPTPRISRERRRLVRLLNYPYDGSKDRLHAVCDEIRREWPQLVHASHSAPPAVDAAEKTEVAA